MNPPTVPFSWNRHECRQSPLLLGATLASGQNFRWRRDADGAWWGTVGDTIVAAWQAPGEPESALWWQTFPGSNRWDLVADYFRLDVDLDALYAGWLEREPLLAPAVQAFRGLRILRQPPEECFFAFQCAACNTVVKIERSVAYLAERYGCPLSGGSGLPFAFYSFPTLNALANADEAALRDGLWGYRAPRVIALARHLQTLPRDWLSSLRHVSYAEAHTALIGLFGVGAKLADCICLFSLDKDEAVPVDTHVRQIAVRLFLPQMAGKTLTPRVYNALADAYRIRFGASAGWAQQLLFFADLHRAEGFERH